jgi:hexokinase
VAGTGFNGALQLPTTALAPEKYAGRAPQWTTNRPSILVDTELCVVGQDIFEMTEWDRRVVPMLPQPDILGLERFNGGRMIGEVIRQVITDAVGTVGLLGGVVPELIQVPFSFGLEKAAWLEV